MLKFTYSEKATTIWRNPQTFFEATKKIISVAFSSEYIQLWENEWEAWKNFKSDFSKV